MNKRKITLDPIREKVLTIPWREVESLIPCGLAVEWIVGEYKGENFSLRTGAGCGSPYMTFSYKDKSFCIDVRDLIQELVALAEETEANDQVRPYRVKLNNELWGDFINLKEEEIIDLGSGVRNKNTIVVFYKGKCILDIDTEDGKIVETRWQKSEFFQK